MKRGMLLYLTGNDGHVSLFDPPGSAAEAFSAPEEDEATEIGIRSFLNMLKNREPPRDWTPPRGSFSHVISPARFTSVPEGRASGGHLVKSGRSGVFIQATKSKKSPSDSPTSHPLKRTLPASSNTKIFVRNPNSLKKTLKGLVSKLSTLVTSKIFY
ncbi:hypothetical protein Ccrd_001000 [Cynara cardunculus var. scolymus]|uniref:Uncharacterized protein n=1 Tax=Cynara cardunculus var. scolymus TaxID=59895 RepID=A0A118JY49_CYNCS|nr:hypothetical protein Ccrd_001000 [Cynara cardunculus var. scolymus]